MRNKKPIDTFFVSSHFCEQLLTFFQEERRVIGDESKDHGAVDESSAEQQICGSASITFVVTKNWAYPPSASGSYWRQGGRRNTVGFHKIKFSIQVKLFGFLLGLTLA